MAKKSKSNSSSFPKANAPDYQQILAQPAHNPYYPDPHSAHTTKASAPPPPYTSPRVPNISTRTADSVPMSQLNNIAYPRIDGSNSVDVQTPYRVQLHDFRYDVIVERYRHKVRTFNAQTIILGALSIALALWSHSLYERRNCISQMVVHKWNDMEFRQTHIHAAHIYIAYASAFLILLCVLKSAIGFNSMNHGCYLFIISLYTFGVFVAICGLNYLVFYGPCTLGVGEIGKTIISKVVNGLPSPDKGLFGESNIIERAKDDQCGLAIFVMDVFQAIFYFSIFINSILLC